jgi:CRISPR/Cas system CSM-associated protein Csm4 (group 5 of RAMP superfamily)
MAALTADQASYRLVTVGGWCGNDEGQPRKRRRVRLLTEGSVIRWTQEPVGQLVDVNPQAAGDRLPHPVYRNGFGMALRVEEKALEATP